jgi:hypothetical protein
VCNVDNAWFYPVDTEAIPEGYMSVPDTVNDNGFIYNTRMLAMYSVIKALKGSFVRAVLR